MSFPKISTFKGACQLTMKTNKVILPVNCFFSGFLMQNVKYFDHQTLAKQTPATELFTQEI